MKCFIESSFVADTFLQSIPSTGRNCLYWKYWKAFCATYFAQWNKTYPLLSKYFICLVLTVLGFCLAGPTSLALQAYKRRPWGRWVMFVRRSAWQRRAVLGEEGRWLSDRAGTPPAEERQQEPRQAGRHQDQPRQIFSCTEHRSSSSAADRRTLGLSVSPLSSDPDWCLEKD